MHFSKMAQWTNNWFSRKYTKKKKRKEKKNIYREPTGFSNNINHHTATKIKRFKITTHNHFLKIKTNSVLCCLVCSYVFQ